MNTNKCSRCNRSKSKLKRQRDNWKARAMILRQALVAIRDTLGTLDWAKGEASEAVWYADEYKGKR